jgi:RNase P subunit RPR2
MMSITCPSCGEIGRIPIHLMGIPIKCKKCRGGLLVSSSVSRPATTTEAAITPPLAVARSHGGGFDARGRARR